MNRSIKELLQLMLDNQQLFGDGLCFWSVNLLYAGLITASDLDLLEDYIIENRPQKIKGSVFWWPKGEIAPRIEWLKEHIKINS